MQAWPGSMSGCPRVPPVQRALLVHVGAASSGSGGPASGGGGGGAPPSTTQLPAGIPELTHAWKALASAAGTLAFGGGGMGEAVDCIRVTQRAPLVSAGYPGDADCRAARVARDWGAPPLGVAP